MKHDEYFIIMSEIEKLQFKIKQDREAIEILRAAVTSMTPSYNPKASSGGGGEDRSMEDGVLSIVEIEEDLERDIESLELLIKSLGDKHNL